MSTVKDEHPPPFTPLPALPPAILAATRYVDSTERGGEEGVVVRG